MGRITRRVEEDGVKAIYINEKAGEDFECFLENEYGYKTVDKLAAYEDIIDEPEKLKLIDALYLERCEEINRLNKIIEALAKKLLNTEFGGCYMCKNPMKNITIDGVNNGCDGECNTTEKSSVEDFLKKFISELERMKEVAGC